MSINKKLFAGIFTFILAFVLVATVGFSAFMPDFVQKAKEEEMYEIAMRLKAVDDDQALESAILDVTASSDLSVTLALEDGTELFSAPTRGLGKGNRQSEGMGKSAVYVKMQALDTLYTVEHHSLGIPFMVYATSYDSTRILYIMRPVRSIDDVVEVANHFFFIIAVVAVLTGLVFSLIYSRSFSKPIREINKIAHYMAELDFSHTYDRDGKDEIAQLGRSINHMSSQLKSALNKLEAEIREKEKLHQLQKVFLADASHELKTPLTVILGNLDQLKDKTALASGSDRYVNTALKEAEHMSRIIQDLLTLSEIESETHVLSKRKVDLASIIDDVLYAYSGLMSKREINLEYDVDDMLPVRADIKKMETVFRNLIGNAILHSELGATVRISSRIEGTHVRLEVFNESEPLEDDVIFHAFDRFRRFGPSGDMDEGKKTGLGLAIVKSILELHGFTYGLENAKGGVLFFIQARLEQDKI